MNSRMDEEIVRTPAVAGGHTILILISDWMNLRKANRNPIRIRIDEPAATQGFELNNKFEGLSSRVFGQRNRSVDSRPAFRQRISNADDTDNAVCAAMSRLLAPLLRLGSRNVSVPVRL